MHYVSGELLNTVLQQMQLVVKLLEIMLLKFTSLSSSTILYGGSLLLKWYCTNEL